MLLFLLSTLSEEPQNKFAEIEGLYKDVMTFAPNKITHNKTLTEEVVQDAFIKIILHIDDVDEI